MHDYNQKRSGVLVMVQSYLFKLNDHYLCFRYLVKACAQCCHWGPTKDVAVGKEVPSPRLSTGAVRTTVVPALSACLTAESRSLPCCNSSTSDALQRF